MIHLTTDKNDPFNILASTKKVLLEADDVTLHPENISSLTKKIVEHIESNSLDTAIEHYGVSGDVHRDCQLVFLQDCVNFCFWSQKSDERWQIKFKDKIVEGGWYGLVTAFARAIDEEVPLLDARWLAQDMTLDDLKQIFRSENEKQIPLLEERFKCLQEAGRVLMDTYNGQAINILESSNYDAVKIVSSVVNNFSSFKDVGKYNNNDVYFYKRAQILASDWSHIEGVEVKNLGALTAFADYKLPQILEHYNVLEYSSELLKNIDAYELIERDDPKEIEIRAGIIWALELIRQEIPKYTTEQIDYALWLITQDKKVKASMMHPYHRTYTIFY